VIRTTDRLTGTAVKDHAITTVAATGTQQDLILTIASLRPSRGTRLGSFHAFHGSL